MYPKTIITADPLPSNLRGGYRVQAAPAGSSFRARLAARAGQVLFIMVPIVNVFWYPLFTIDVNGNPSNLVPMDVLLLCSWLFGVLNLVMRKSKISRQERIAWKIVILVNLPLLLSPLASVLTVSGSNLLAGLLVHLKRIGLASILLPLAVQYSAQRVQRAIIMAVLVSIIFLIAADPNSLGLNAQYIDYIVNVVASSGRSVGLFYNPNTLGFVTGMYMLFLIAFLGKKTSIVVNCLLLTGIVVAAVMFQSAASRTAAAALVVALLYVIVKRRSLFAIWLFAALVVLGVIFNDTKPVSQQSLLVTRILGIEQIDQNFSTRLDIQSRVVANIINWPLGTGIGNLGVVAFGMPVDLPTTDSLYVDYLAAMGVLGSLSIIGVLILIWRQLKGNSEVVVAAQVILIFVALFSLGEIGLASNFISPLFFLFMGMGFSVCADRESVNGVQGESLSALDVRHSIVQSR